MNAGRLEPTKADDMNIAVLVGTTVGQFGAVGPFAIAVVSHGHPETAMWWISKSRWLVRRMSLSNHARNISGVCRTPPRQCWPANRCSNGLAIPTTVGSKSPRDRPERSLRRMMAWYIANFLYGVVTSARLSPRVGAGSTGRSATDTRTERPWPMPVSTARICLSGHRRVPRPGDPSAGRRASRCRRRRARTGA